MGRKKNKKKCNDATGSVQAKQGCIVNNINNDLLYMIKSSSFSDFFNLYGILFRQFSCLHMTNLFRLFVNSLP
jgi:hypothetical protein